MKKPMRFLLIFVGAFLFCICINLSMYEASGTEQVQPPFCLVFWATAGLIAFGVGISNIMEK